MIGAGRTGGSSMDELEVSGESSGSIRGAGGGKDFLLDLGMMDYRGTRRAILSHGQKS